MIFNKRKRQKEKKNLDLFAISGCIDGVVGTRLRGWVSDHQQKSISIDIFIDSILVEENYFANNYRDDLSEASIGDGCLAFDVELPKELLNGNESLVCVRKSGSASEKQRLEKIVSFPDLGNSGGGEVNKVLGSVDRFVGDMVAGWISGENVYPYLTANGVPCFIHEYGIERPDVKAKLGGSSNVGFIASMPATPYGNVLFELSSISMDGLAEVAKKDIVGGCLRPDLISAIFEAHEISRREGSVAIAVWEGTHNPIGRAQVLYNILKERRPVVIFAYDIGFSESAVWEPLINSDCKVVMIPWKDRAIYEKLFASINLTFDLIWICKPRYPAFCMAKMLSNKDSRYIVDLDDNEIEMSSSKAAQDKPYGLLSAKMAQRYLDKMLVRSVASQTLKDDFGGELVRHARKLKVVRRSRSMSLEDEVRVGFIGTVRPHKGVVEAARAIKDLNSRKGYNIKFVVGGIYDPVSIRSELIDLGCEVHGKIDSARLDGHLQNLDVVITGFPDNNANKEILRYQISSKIGDGLSNERPVLVPDGESVKDLANIPGIYLFDSLNFERILENAVASKDLIQMNEQFTLEYNFQKFKKLEELAREKSPSGKDLFMLDSDDQNTIVRNKVLLIWKQHDTGLYGRRVDHLARSLSISGYDVTCLELISEEQYKRYEKESSRVDSDYSFLVNDFRKKRNGYTEDGISFKSLVVDFSQSADFALKRYMIENNMLPTNTVVVLFPAVPEWKSVAKVVAGYDIICDVVDNQLAWEKRKPLELLGQYKHIIDISGSVVFNSEDNYKFFENAGYLEGKQSQIIPNWYVLPQEYAINVVRKSCEANLINVVYSGNMNDRFDWDTVARLVKEIDAPIAIHLIGNCQRSLDKMTYLLNSEKIHYHGPMREIDLLYFMSKCDLAIMPHIHDEHSGFMNPMKVNMYQAIGMPCVVSSMPGVDFEKSGIIKAENSDHFVESVKSVVLQIISGEFESGIKKSDDDLNAIRYVNLIKEIFENKIRQKGFAN